MLGCLGIIMSFGFLCIVGWAFSVHALFGWTVLVGTIVLLVIFIDREGKRKKELKAQALSQIDIAYKELENINFTVSQKHIGKDNKTSLAIDENSQKIGLIEGNKQKTFSYRDILQSEIIEDGVQITTTSRSSQIGGALIGSVLAGGVGAIIGGLSARQIASEEFKKIDLRIIVNDTQNPVFVLNFMNQEDFPVKQASPIYKEAIEKANRWHYLISVLIKKADQEDQLTQEKERRSENNSSTSSVAEELLKLSTLVKEGMITQEEFNVQKAKILN